MIVSGGEALVDLVPDPVPGGGPMNVAIAATRLGVASAFLGRVSTDAHGQQIWDHLVSNAVDLRLAERGDEPTARAIVEHTPKLRFRFEGDGTADQALTSASLEPIGSGPHILHGGTLGLFRGRTAEVLADAAERHDGIVSLDPNVRPQIIDDRARWDHFHDRWVARTHVYRGSDEDFEWIWPGRSAEDCAAELLDRGVLAVMITRGPEGAVVLTTADQVQVPGVSVDVVDTVGAGDTFVAGVLASLADRGLSGEPEGLNDLTAADWTDIAGFAARAAAVTCSRPGADPPTAAELGVAPLSG